MNPTKSPLSANQGGLHNSQRGDYEEKMRDCNTGKDSGIMKAETPKYYGIKKQDGGFYAIVDGSILDRRGNPIATVRLIADDFAKAVIAMAYALSNIKESSPYGVFFENAMMLGVCND